MSAITYPTATIAPPRTKGRPSRSARLGRSLFTLSGVGGLVCLVAWAWLSADLPSTTQQLRVLEENQIVLRKRPNGTVQPVCHCRQAVSSSEIPKFVKLAIVAIEDRRFYEHAGVDLKAIVRATLANLAEDRIAQGASTLEMQLMKNMLLSSERTLYRKLREAVLALQLSSKLSKDEILLAYANNVVFGDHLGRPIVGIEQAALHFFGKRSRELNLFEGAMLAGLVNGPTIYNPRQHPDAAAKRAQKVLEKMVDQRLITEAEKSAALRVGSTPGQLRPSWPEARYFSDSILAQLPKIAPGTQLQAGMRISVTINMAEQALAERAVRKLIDETRGGATEAALISMSFDGAIRAMVGGHSYVDSQYNRAIQARRQPGSVFKPFVYLAALEAGYTPSKKILDAPYVDGTWAPRNFDGRYYGLVTMQDALALSLNSVAVRLAKDVGYEKVALAAKRCGVTTPLRPNKSISLGTSEVTLVEITAAIGVFGNHGRGVKAHGVVGVFNNDGRVLHWRETRQPQQVVTVHHADLLHRMLRRVVTHGTGKVANISPDAAGKTGTSQLSRDAWFVGYTQSRITGVWMGRDDDAPMPKSVTGRTAAKAWADFNKSIHRAR